MKDRRRMRVEYEEDRRTMEDTRRMQKDGKRIGGGREENGRRMRVG
jgi:hypothetical protein